MEMTGSVDPDRYVYVRWERSIPPPQGTVDDDFALEECPGEVGAIDAS